MIMTTVEKAINPKERSGPSLINVVGRLGVREAYKRAYVRPVLKHHCGFETWPYNYGHLANTGARLSYLGLPGRPDKYAFKLHKSIDADEADEAMSMHYFFISQRDAFDCSRVADLKTIQNLLSKYEPLVSNLWSYADIVKAGLDSRRHLRKAAIIKTYGRVQSAIARFMRSANCDSCRAGGNKYGASDLEALITLGFECVQLMIIEDGAKEPENPFEEVSE